MPKTEPNVVEVNRLISGEPGPASQTVDVEYALAALRFPSHKPGGGTFKNI
jgi:hypothetical protein